MYKLVTFSGVDPLPGAYLLSSLLRGLPRGARASDGMISVDWRGGYDSTWGYEDGH